MACTTTDHAAALIAVYVGAIVLDGRAKQREPSRLTRWILPIVAGWLWLRSDFFQHCRSTEAALAFCTMSPVIGFIWWGFDCRIRRFLLQLICGLAIAMALSVPARLVNNSASTSAFALVVGLVTSFLPWRTMRSNFRRAVSRRRALAQEADRKRREELESVERARRQEEQEHIVEQLLQELRE